MNELLAWYGYDKQVEQGAGERRYLKPRDKQPPRRSTATDDDAMSATGSTSSATRDKTSTGTYTTGEGKKRQVSVSTRLVTYDKRSTGTCTYTTCEGTLRQIPFRTRLVRVYLDDKYRHVHDLLGLQ